MKTEHHILLVEDDQVDIENVLRAFKKNDVPVKLHIAHNGIEALEMLKGKNALKPIPKIILLDINMPQMNGIEFLKEIRNDSILNSLTVIVLTTSDDERDKIDAHNYNVSGYMLKPNSFDKFVKNISVLTDYLDIIELPRIKRED